MRRRSGDPGWQGTEPNIRQSRLPRACANNYTHVIDRVRWHGESAADDRVAVVILLSYVSYENVRPP
jgi:hypothetical protein